MKSGQNSAISAEYKEILVEQRVTYTLEMEGKAYIVENVPARVNAETGEQFFAPSTAERLQETILEYTEPSKAMKPPYTSIVSS